MKKISIIVTIVCFTLCIACTISCICLSVSCDYAETHYTVTQKITGYTAGNAAPGQHSYNWPSEWSYGCGEFDCKYCNGQLAEHQKNTFSDYDYFVYYRTASDFKTASFVGAIFFGVSSAAFFALSFKKTRKIA